MNTRRRRRTLNTLAFLLVLAALTEQGDAFGFRKLSRKLSRSRDFGGETQQQSGRFADQNDGVNSWSKRVDRKSSPLQVRNRVRAVLAKAKKRTGVETRTVKASNIVADAASIGGLAEDVVIQVKLPTSSSVDQSRKFPDEDLVVEKIKVNGTPEKETKGNSERTPKDFERKPQDFDVVRGDTPSANAFVEPLPFKLPKLSAEQIQLLQADERIQEQSRMGRAGDGYVVLDVKAPPYVVWEVLLDFENYPDTIPTVREMQLYTSEKLKVGYVNEKPVLPGTGRETRHYGTPSVTRAKFVLSKFRLNIAAVHKYTPHPDGDYMIFTLDKSCTNMVLKGAKGIWHCQPNPDGREVGFSCK